MNFDVIIEKANTAAANAAAKWYEEAIARGPKYSVHNHPIGGEKGPAIDYMLDLCGFAWLEFRDRRSAFYRHVKKLENAENARLGRRNERTLYRVPVGGPYRQWMGRQEMGLKEAAMRAARDVYVAHGIKVYMMSRLD